MRVSACGWVTDTLEETLDLAKRSAEVSHNSQEGIEGAQAISAAIFLARTGHNKQGIKQYIEETFGYDLDNTVASIGQHARRTTCARRVVTRLSAAGLSPTPTSRPFVMPSPSAQMLTP